jgi:hypothetical protein
MKRKLSKTIATAIALAIIFSCMVFAAPAAFAADGNSGDSPANTEELIAFAKEHPVLAKIGLKLALWAAGNAIEGAAEGVGDHYEEIGEDTGDRFDNWADDIEDGNIAEAEDPKVIVGDLVDGATDAEEIGQDAADGATNSFPLCIVGKFKPEITEGLNAKLADKFSSAFQKVFDKLPAIGE